MLQPAGEKVLADHSDQEVEAYQLKPRDFYLPYLKVPGRTRSQPGLFVNDIPLTAAELPVLRRAAERIAALADTPLGPAARSAVRKLAFDLPELQVGTEEQSFSSSAEIDAQFATLRAAVEGRRAVQCRYYTIRRDEEAKRVIEPYGLMLSWGHWYCVARPHPLTPSPRAERGNEPVKVFRLDRMKDAILLDREFAVPPGFKIASYLNRAPWELSEDAPVTVRVRINFPQSRWVIGERLGKVVKRVTDDAGSEFEFEVRAPDAFIRWLLPLGKQAEVLSPPSFKKRLDDARAQLRAVYR